MIVLTLFKPFFQVFSETSISLVLSLNPASPDVRLLAVKPLAERIAAGETLESFCAQSLLQRLRDDKLQVVNAAHAIGKVHVRPALLVPLSLQRRPSWVVAVDTDSEKRNWVI